MIYESQEVSLVKIKDGADGTNGKSAITATLSNDSHVIPCDKNGANGNYTGANTSIAIYEGTTDASDSWTVTATPSAGITGSLSGKRYTVSGISTDSGYVDLTATKPGYSSITKRFNVSKTKNGEDGEAPTVYWLVTSASIISKNTSGVLSPSAIILNAKSQTGNALPVNYSGRFSIYLNGNTTASYASSTDETSKSYIIPAGTTSVRCVLYRAGKTSMVLDEQTIPVVSDGVAGSSGRGISGITEYYLANTNSSGVTTSTSGWSESIPTITATNKYLWNYEIVKYTDNSSVSTLPKIIGVYGDQGNNGSDGKGIKNADVTYQSSTSGTTTPTGTWNTTIPNVAANQYLWTKTTITYTDNSTSTSYSIGKMGATGSKGEDGKGILSTTVTYQSSTSGTTVPTGTWSTGIPNVAQNQYLWTRTAITYTDNTNSISYAIGKMGATGATGNGIKSIVNYYLASASASGVTASTSGWTTTIQTITTTNKYLWNYEIVTYTNNSTYTSTPVIIGAYGNTGTAGASGTGYSVLLTNENHTFSANTSAAIAGSTSTNVIAYKNMTQIAATISKIGATSVSGNQTNIATGITGLTAAITNNGTNTVAITFNATTALTTKSGTVAITVVIDGKIFSKNFSFALAFSGVNGAAGAAAKAVDITATSQVFKSTDGGITFSPDNIKLTPIFQGGLAFSKWQYSQDGGTTWKDAASGSNGLSVSGGILTINKTSDLFTSAITSLSFKVITNNASYFDVISVLKLYDVTDIEIGGRNLIVGSIKYTKETPLTHATTRTDGSVILPTMVMPIETGETYTFQCCTDGIWGEHKTDGTGGGATHIYAYLMTDTDKVGSYTKAVALTAILKVNSNTTGLGVWQYKIPTDKAYTKIMFRIDIHSDNVKEYSYKYWNFKAEKGNKATDWTPAPEDIQNQIIEVTDSVAGVKSIVDQDHKSITDKVWQSDITNKINTYDNTTSKELRDRVTQSEKDITGIRNTVSSVQTNLNKKADGTTVTELTNRVAKAEQDANGFKQTVSSTYATQANLNKTNNKVTNLQQTGLGFKVNYSSFATAENGELYLHGYETSQGTPADIDGWVLWNGAKITVPKGMVNPNTICPYSTPIYIVRRTSNNTSYLVWYNSGWKWSVLQPTAVGGAWTWNVATDIVLGVFVEPSNEGAIVGAQLFTPPKTAEDIKISSEVSSSINQKADEITHTVSATYETKANVSQISQKVDSITNKVSTAEGNISKLQQTANEITSTVTKANKRIDDISVGNVNIATNTNHGNIGWSWGMQTGTYISESITESEIECCKFTRNDDAQSGWSTIQYLDVGRDKYSANTEYIISLEIKPNVDTTFAANLQESNGTNSLLSTAGASLKVIKDKWNKLIWHVKTKETLPNSTLQLLYLSGMSSAPKISYMFRNLKIEKSNLTEPTDWSPAPEDYESEFSKITQDIGGISTTVKDIGENVSSVMQTASKLTVDFEDITEDLSTLSNKVGEVDKTVSGNYSTIQASISNISSEINTVKKGVQSNSQILQTADDWKALFAQIGMYDVPDVITHVLMSIYGIEVSNPEKGTKTMMTTENFAGYYNDGTMPGDGIMTFGLQKDQVIAEKLVANKGCDFITSKLVPIIYENNNVKHPSLVFVKSSK